MKTILKIFSQLFLAISGIVILLIVLGFTLFLSIEYLQDSYTTKSLNSQWYSIGKRNNFSKYTSSRKLVNELNKNKRKKLTNISDDQGSGRISIWTARVGQKGNFYIEIDSFHNQNGNNKIDKFEKLN